MYAIKATVIEQESGREVAIVEVRNVPRENVYLPGHDTPSPAMFLREAVYAAEGV
jgi:hypothetical protein